MSPDDLPPFPAPPPGVCRFRHRPTIAAGLRYWRAVADRLDPDDPARATAEALVLAYTGARAELAAEKRRARA